MLESSRDSYILFHEKSHQTPRKLSTTIKGMGLFLVNCKKVQALPYKASGNVSLCLATPRFTFVILLLMQHFARLRTSVK